jgi:S-DNA-T family DNA segregation ATPase FtsK/SpoIIIE
VDVKIGSGLTTYNFLGPVGAHMADIFLWMLGLSAFALNALLGLVGVKSLFRRPPRLTLGTISWTLVGVVMLSVLLQVGFRDFRPLGYHPAGRLGLYAGEGMVALLSDGGAALVAGLTLGIAIAYVSGGSIGVLLRFIGRMLAAAGLRAVGFVASMFASAARRIGVFFRRPARASDARDPVPAANDGNDPHDTRIDRPRTFPSETMTRDGPRVFGPSMVSVSHPDVVFPRALDIPQVVPAGRGDTAPRISPRIQDGPESTAPVPVDVGSVAANGVADTTSEPRIVLTPQKAPVAPESAVNAHAPAEGHYDPPPLSLLDMVESRGLVVDRALLHRNAETLERKLLDYRVEGKVVEIHPGPVVTMYEFLPAPGVKISQIANLADDLTMALEAVSIRIVAPIPGKGVVGIEVPNAVRETVYLREVLASEVFRKSRSKLTLALGKDIFGTPVVTDLARMPHLLIAGATGSGKSVAVNAFILSLLHNASPDEVRIILVDPKIVELQVYEGVPHLLLPVVYDPKHAAAALRWAVDEMERRYDLLARFGARNLQSFNQRVDRMLGRGVSRTDEHDTVISPPQEELFSPDGTSLDHDPDELKRLPYIVIVLDEFADLMMVASKDVETAVARLAQKARAAGIHLVMATQRPSKEVITGLIKANFPSRIAFRVSSKIDSRIILDQSGADALLGFGDMLFLQPGSSLLTRCHGPFVSDEEVHRVVTHLKAQGSPEYRMEILQASDEDAEDEDPADVDALLNDAQDIVVESRRASISFLQRRLKIGYNRAARIMEQIERRGVVGPPDSRGERQVLV